MPHILRRRAVRLLAHPAARRKHRRWRGVSAGCRRVPSLHLSRLMTSGPLQRKRRRDRGRGNVPPPVRRIAAGAGRRSRRSPRGRDSRTGRRAPLDGVARRRPAGTAARRLGGRVRGAPTVTMSGSVCPMTGPTRRLRRLRRRKRDVGRDRSPDRRASGLVTPVRLVGRRGIAPLVDVRSVDRRGIALSAADRLVGRREIALPVDVRSVGRRVAVRVVRGPLPGRRGIARRVRRAVRGSALAPVSGLVQR
ncbi:MAG: hypothetical protein NTZ05_19565 [Chloroflexi bacterium]|nr:hypothetical protein [Chloroflexota bacterium]